MKTMRQTTFFALLFLTALAAITACNRQPKAPEISPLTEEESARFLEQGQEIAQATFAAMSGRLQAAMQEGESLMPLSTAIRPHYPLPIACLAFTARKSAAPA